LKLLKHSKIDLEKSFNSDQSVTLSLRKKVKGKQVYDETPTRLDSIKKYIPYCYYILNKIIQYQLLHKTSWYVGLSSIHLNKEINSDNRYSAISILIAMGVIDENEHYNCIGEYGKLYPKSYKISSEYISDIMEFEMEVKLCKHKSNMPISIVENGVIDHSPVKTTKSIEFDSFEHHSKANSNHLDIDRCDTLESYQSLGIIVNTNNKRVGAIPLYHTDYQIRNLKEINYDSGAAFALLEYQKTNNQIDQKKRKNQVSDYHRIKYQIEKLMTKSAYFSIGKTGRFTTTVNQIDSEYRSFIKDKHGNDLMEIDFKSSHLNHLIRVIDEDISMGAVSGAINQELLKSEVNELKWMIENQDVYNQVCIKYVNRFNKQIQRDKAKELVLENWINGAYEKRKTSKWVASIYPTITEYIHTINPEESVKGKVKRNRKPLSNRLLTSEALLVNELIVGRLAKEFPNSTAYTVFDSILIDEDHVDHLYRIMMEESDKYFGFSCKIEMKENDVESKLKKKENRILSKTKRENLMPSIPSEESYSNLEQEFLKSIQTNQVVIKSTPYVLDEALEKILDEICKESLNGSWGKLSSKIKDSGSDTQNATQIFIDGDISVPEKPMPPPNILSTEI
jgi:hypothetical protein